MLVSEILRGLPASLEWMVLFNISAIRQLTDDNIVRAMYHLPEELDLSTYSHVVLANTGRFLALHERIVLVDVVSGRECPSNSIQSSLYDRFAQQLALFSVDEADCLGLGELSPYAPVLLHIRIESGYGEANAIFEQQPSTQHYELLQAVGVQFLGGEQKRDYYLAQFRNQLPVHIHAGILSHFSRTGHCNLFFLQQGTVDARLESGLLQAADHRIQWGWQRGGQVLAALAARSASESFAMTCLPAFPATPFSYGNLVPLGFVLRALSTAMTRLNDRLPPLTPALNELNAKMNKAAEQLQTVLMDHRQDDLWAFHTGRLVTATDSVLVLQGLAPQVASQSLLALEQFADGQGGYYPQSWADQPQPGKMAIDAACHHWCQPDYATTCLVRSLRQAAQLPTQTPLSVLAEGMSDRAGLYFANPYLVDWAVAQAIATDEAAVALQQLLLDDTLESMNPDYSFGTYDLALSTALAILTLAALNYRGRWLRAAQLRLLSYMEADGRFPIAIPFYSSLRIDHEVSPEDRIKLLLVGAAVSQTQRGQKQIRQVGEQCHSISLYQDTNRLIGTALATLALTEAHVVEASEFRPQFNPHPRYQCKTHSDYIARFALPPYCKSELYV